MAGKLIVVTGITGNQGGSVARTFLDAGWKVRGITRDPSKPSSAKWRDVGVEVVAGDFDQPDALRSAFQGASVIFANTDFWSGLQRPEVHQRATEGSKTVLEIAHDLEVQHGKNVLEAAASVVDGLDRLVMSTLSATSKWSEGKYTHSHHFDAKADQVEYLYNTPALAELRKKTSLVQLPLFINNWKTDASAFMMPAKQPDGTYLLRLPMSGERKLPMGDPTNITGPLVLALTKVAPEKMLVASAGMLSFQEWCEKVGKQIGATVRYEVMPRKELEEMIPGELGLEMADMFQYFQDFGYDGGDPSVIYPDQLGIDLKYQTTDEYFQEEDWSKVTNQ